MFVQSVSSQSNFMFMYSIELNLEIFSLAILLKQISRTKTAFWIQFVTWSPWELKTLLFKSRILQRLSSYSSISSYDLQPILFYNTTWVVKLCNSHELFNQNILLQVRVKKLNILMCQHIVFNLKLSKSFIIVNSLF